MKAELTLTATDLVAIRDEIHQKKGNSFTVYYSSDVALLTLDVVRSREKTVIVSEPRAYLNGTRIGVPLWLENRLNDIING